MGELCEIFLDQDVYQPGETVTGKIMCNFDTENQVNGIRVLMKGRAKVYWKEGRYTVYQDDKMYFEFETALVDNETTFAPGLYEYPISFELPNALPSSMEETHGNVRYKVQAVIDRPWSFDHVCRLPFTVYSVNNLNEMEDLNQPTQSVEEKIPFALFGQSPPIKVLVNLPQSCYAPNDTVSFFVKIINESAVCIEDVRFRIIQGYTFYARNRSTQHISYISEECANTDFEVKGESEGQWNLEITVPADIFIGVLDDCDVIKIFGSYGEKYVFRFLTPILLLTCHWCLVLEIKIETLFRNVFT
ncbi:hypothetical protein RN001_011355 [Aquatica leii]|uniref:Arrestin domain-containing protein 3 n=1 Tax=Aquatica leii TaxID=1421715 RepID=A0AAN7SGL8_9COLE|nr:hypothetical protein RN001_011355 [Aquatica leii]